MYLKGDRTRHSEYQDALQLTSFNSKRFEMHSRIASPLVVHFTNSKVSRWRCAEVLDPKLRHRSLLRTSMLRLGLTRLFSRHLYTPRARKHDANARGREDLSKLFVRPAGSLLVVVRRSPVCQGGGGGSKHVVPRVRRLLKTRIDGKDARGTLDHLEISISN